MLPLPENSKPNDKLTEFIEKNPRAALNYAVVLALMFVVSVSMLLFRRDDSRVEAQILDLKKELAEVKAENRKIRFSLDSANGAHYLQLYSIKDSANREASALNKKLEAKIAEFQDKFEKQQNNTVFNNKLSSKLQKKTEILLKEIPKNEN